MLRPNTDGPTYGLHRGPSPFANIEAQRPNSTSSMDKHDAPVPDKSLKRQKSRKFGDPSAAEPPRSQSRFETEGESRGHEDEGKFVLLKQGEQL